VLDPRRLVLLATVARHASLTQAAGELGYSASALSQQIAALEREAGATVLERLPRGVRLTDAGRALAAAGERVAAELRDARAALEALGDLQAGTLRVAAFASAWNALVPDAVTAFRAAHPQVELALLEAEPPEALAALRAGDLDVAVVFTTGDAQEQPDLELDALGRDPLHAVLPRGHRLAGRRRIALSALAEEAWVQPTRACAALVQAACERAGFTPRTAFASDDYGAIQGFVAAGAGVALIPALALGERRRDVAVLPLAPPVPARGLVAARRRRSRSPAADALVERLRAAAAARAGGGASGPHGAGTDARTTIDERPAR